MVRLYLSAGQPEARVLDLSASGGSIISSENFIEKMTHMPAVLHAGEYPPINLQIAVVRSIAEGALTRIGVQFERLDRRDLKNLSLFLIDRFLEQSERISSSIVDALSHHEGQRRVPGPSIGSPRRDLVRRLLMFHAVSHHRCIHVYRGELMLPLLLRASGLSVEAARQLIVTDVLSGDSDVLGEGEEYSFTFPGISAINYFTASIWRCEAGRVLITLPPSIRQTGFRGSLRIGLLPDRRLDVFFNHPRLPGIRLRKHVLDVSARGFSFPLDPERDMLCPGDRIGRVFICLPGEPVRAETVVRSIMDTDERRGVACGIEIVGFPGEDDEERWKRFVFSEGYPRLRLGEKKMVSTTWDVLKSSKYLDEATAAIRPYLAKSFFFSWMKHSDKTWLSRYFLIFKEGRPVGTVAANVIYPDTWLVHHLGIDERERKADRQGLFDMAREAYCGMQYLLRNMAPLKFFVIYADAGKAWNDLIYGEFLRRYSDHEDFLYDGYKVYKCQPQAKPGKLRVALNSIEVIDGRPELLSQLSQHQKIFLSETEFKAFCYGRKEIELVDFSRKCADDGYERERRIFFAIEGCEPLAALVAETGEEGINVFGLFNKCWFVYLKPEAARNDLVKVQLLRRATRYYWEKGKKEFILVGNVGGEPDDLLDPLGFYYVADGFRFLARRKIIPAWMSYVEEAMRMICG